VTTVGETEIDHGLPWPLPDGRTLLVTVRRQRWSWGEEEVVAYTRATGARKSLLRHAADARYLPTGHLVFLRRGVLVAVPFDAQRLEIRGAEAPLLDAVAQGLTAGNSADITGAGQFAVSDLGTLAWVSSPVVGYPDLKLVTVDRRGVVAALAAPVRSYAPTLRLSPDGRRLAVAINSLTEMGLWLYDLGRGVLTPLVREGEAAWPRWWPDGQRLVFSWLAGGRGSVATVPADGTAAPRVIATRAGVPASFTPDGTRLAVIQGTTGADITIVTPGPGAASVTPWLKTPETERWPEFSPDGRWLAYGSDAAGRYEIYLRPYPGPGPAQQVSVEGGTTPA
jgi:eukaryotic-like serine/threonine-protein kinase